VLLAVAGAHLTSQPFSTELPIAMPGWLISCSFHWALLSRSGLAGETISFRNDDNATIGNREALRVVRAIEPDSLAGRDHHVLVDDATLQLSSFTSEGSEIMLTRWDSLFWSD
jgi:hypothetical protein